MQSVSAKNGPQNRNGGQGRIEKLPQWISPEQESAISKIDHYKNSEHLFLDLNEFLNSYMLNFVERQRWSREFGQMDKWKPCFKISVIRLGFLDHFQR